MFLRWLTYARIPKMFCMHFWSYAQMTSAYPCNHAEHMVYCLHFLPLANVSWLTTWCHQSQVLSQRTCDMILVQYRNCIHGSIFGLKFIFFKQMQMSVDMIEVNTHLKHTSDKVHVKYILIIVIKDALLTMHCWPISAQQG